MSANPAAVTLRHLQSDDDILRSFPVMAELRQDVASAESYLAAVRRMEAAGGYRLLAALAGEEVLALAGYRFGESLAWGRYLYVDDFVTSAARRSTGLGARLCEALREEARRMGCRQFHLDSGVQRHAAHRFYLRERMDITCFHFQREIASR